MQGASEVERVRQRTIAQYELQDVGTDPEFDSVTNLAADLFDVPIALITILTDDRQIFRGCSGLEVSGTPRGVAFCNMTVEQPDVFVVENAPEDPRFRDNPLVTGEPYIRFYAGAPIIIGDGVSVGSLCLIDRRQRTIGKRDCERLKMLARTVADMIELRIGSRVAEARKTSLERQSELLRATIDHVQQGIGVFDSELKLVLWNNLLFDFLELPRELCEEGCDAQVMLLAAAKAGIFGPGDAQAQASELLQSIRSTPSRRLDVHLASGRILDAWRAAISDGRSILAVQDVTEQRRAERMKDEFVSTVSHELRTPLTSIKGALAILSKSSEDQLDQRGAQMLDIAIRNIDRLNTLINDILDIEKLGSGSLAMDLAPTDLCSLLETVASENRPFAATHGVEIALAVPEQPMIVSADQKRLVQAVTNLISNACKFSPAGAVVDLRCSQAGKDAIIEVSDRGPGIPVEFRPHIFRRFAQAGPEHQQGRAGSGLGLAITKAIVEEHGGEIGFDSVGSGARFWLKLPLAEQPS